jgi:hypothetical protein
MIINTPVKRHILDKQQTKKKEHLDYSYWGLILIILIGVNAGSPTRWPSADQQQLQEL